MQMQLTTVCSHGLMCAAHRCMQLWACRSLLYVAIGSCVPLTADFEPPPLSSHNDDNDAHVLTPSACLHGRPVPHTCMDASCLTPSTCLHGRLVPHTLSAPSPPS